MATVYIDTRLVAYFKTQVEVARRSATDMVLRGSMEGVQKGPVVIRSRYPVDPMQDW
jgi:hypothetical protein